MKLAPKKVIFCPGCPKKDLKLNTQPQFNIQPVYSQENKRISVISNKDNKKTGKTFTLF